MLKNLISIFVNPKAVFGIVISLAGIYWAFSDFKFVEFAGILKQIDFFILFLATFLLWVTVWLRGIRWKWLFRTGEPITVASLYRSQLIGYFGNNILPLRLGEILRSYLVAKEWNLSKSYVFGTVVLERLLDAMGMAFLGILLLFIYSLGDSIKGYLMMGIILTVIIGSATFILLNAFKEKKPDHPFMKIFRQFIEGLSSVSKTLLAPIFLSTLIIWGIYWIDVHLVQMAFGFQMDWAQSLLVLVFSSMVLSIPSAPGMIGTFHAGVKYIFIDIIQYTPSYGKFSSADGDSFAIILHAYGYILFTVLGAYYFIKSQFHTEAFQSVLTKDKSLEIKIDKDEK